MRMRLESTGSLDDSIAEASRKLAVAQQHYDVIPQRQAKLREIPTAVDPNIMRALDFDGGDRAAGRVGHDDGGVASHRAIRRVEVKEAFRRVMSPSFQGILHPPRTVSIVLDRSLM